MAWYLPSYKDLLENWRYFVDVMYPVTTRKNEQERRLDFVTGGFLEMWSLEDKDASRGRHYKRIVINECGMIPNLEYSWNAAIRATLVDNRGHALFMGTPKGINYFHTLYQNASSDTEWKSFHRTSYDNPVIDAREIDAIKRTAPDLYFRQEYMAEFVNFEGSVFRRIQEAATLQSIDNPVKDRQYIAAVDPAASVDYTVVTVWDVADKACVFFDRFNPSRVLRMKRKRTKSSEIESVTPPKTIPYTSLHLTPLTDLHSKFRFDALFIAELKLFLKGQPWWWYVIGLGLIVAQLLNELEVTRILLVISWVWPIMILGGLGCRESRYDTRQIVFSAPHPVMNQLPAAWLSAFTVIALMGSGALVRFILAGETISILGWMTGVLFIPSLALVSGILTGSSKAFEVVYVLWMYMITQNVPVFDFIGMTPESPLYIYAPLAIILVILAAFARQRQVITRSVTR